MQISEKYQQFFDKYLFFAVAGLIEDEVEFILTIGNYDDWDRPLPKILMEKFPNFLGLKISKVFAQDIEIDYDNMTISVAIGFDDTGDYYKKISVKEIQGIFINNSPIIIKPFPTEKVTPEIERFKTLSLSSIRESGESIGLNGEGIGFSLVEFEKNNHELFKKLGIS